MKQPPPWRVVIDPNVFISATITPDGTLGLILRLIDDGFLVPVVSPHLIGEVVDVLGRPKLAKYVKPGAGAAFEAQMNRLGEWHADSPKLSSFTRDPKDDYLVALALAANADVLASGDDDLISAPGLGVEVLTPRELLTRLGH